MGKNGTKARFAVVLAIYLVWLGALGTLAASTGRAPRDPAGTAARR